MLRCTSLFMIMNFQLAQGRFMAKQRFCPFLGYDFDVQMSEFSLSHNSDTKKINSKTFFQFSNQHLKITRRHSYGHNSPLSHTYTLEKNAKKPCFYVFNLDQATQLNKYSNIYNSSKRFLREKSHGQKFIYFINKHFYKIDSLETPVLECPASSKVSFF